MTLCRIYVFLCRSYFHHGDVVWMKRGIPGDILLLQMRFFWSQNTSFCFFFPFFWKQDQCCSLTWGSRLWCTRTSRNFCRHHMNSQAYPPTEKMHLWTVLCDFFPLSVPSPCVKLVLNRQNGELTTSGLYVRATGQTASIKWINRSSSVCAGLVLFWRARVNGSKLSAVWQQRGRVI